MIDSAIDSAKFIERLKSPNSTEKINTLNEILSICKNKNNDSKNLVLKITWILSDFLCDDDPTVRWLVVDILLDIWKDDWQYKTYKQAIESLRNVNLEERLKALHWLQDITVPNMVQDRDEREIAFAIPAVAVSIWDENEEVSFQSLITIRCAISEDDVSLSLPSVMKILNGTNSKLRKEAIFIIRDVITSDRENKDIWEFIPELEKLLLDPLESVKFGASDALAYHYAKNKDWPKVKMLLNHSDKDVRQETVGTLNKVYSVSISPVIEDIKNIIRDANQHEDLRIMAVKTYIDREKELLDSDLILPIIIPMLKNNNDDNRAFAALALRNLVGRFTSKYDHIQKIDDPAALEKLWEHLTQQLNEIEQVFQDGNKKVRDYVFQAMIPYLLRYQPNPHKPNTLQTNSHQKIIQLLQAAPSDVEHTILHTLQEDPYPKSQELLQYMAKIIDSKFIQKINTFHATGKKELILRREDFDSIRFVNIPPEIRTLNYITRLDITGHDLTTIPKEIGELINIETLSLTSNNLRDLPPEIGNLNSLTTLYLYRNQLRTLPNEFCLLSKLKYLQLIQNKLEQLPEEFGNLKSLEYLELQENFLSTLPSSFSDLKSLKSLNIRQNPLQTLPPHFENMKTLEQLIIATTKMHEIPPEVFILPKLEYLDFSFNHLRVIPGSIGRVTSLKTLELRNNELRTLPSEIGDLKNLRSLDISNNNLRELPEEILNLRSLGYLQIGGNPLLKIPAELLHLNTLPRKILDAYFKGRK